LICIKAIRFTTLHFDSLICLIYSIVQVRKDAVNVCTKKHFFYTLKYEINVLFVKIIK